MTPAASAGPQSQTGEQPDDLHARLREGVHPHLRSILGEVRRLVEQADTPDVAGAADSIARATHRIAAAIEDFRAAIARGGREEPAAGDRPPTEPAEATPPAQPAQARGEEGDGHRGAPAGDVTGWPFADQPGGPAATPRPEEPGKPAPGVAREAAPGEGRADAAEGQADVGERRADADEEAREEAQPPQPATPPARVEPRPAATQSPSHRTRARSGPEPGLPGGQPADTGGAAEPPLPPGARHLVRGDLDVQSAANQVICRVELIRRGAHHWGEGIEVDTPGGRARAAARATLLAAQDALPGTHLALESLAFLDLSGRRYIAVAVEAGAARRFTHLTGIALLDRSAEETACLACLKAIERWAASPWLPFRQSELRQNTA